MNDEYIILGKTNYDYFNSEWLVGYPNSNVESLNNDLISIRERLPQYIFKIIPFTSTTLDEVYPNWNGEMNWRLNNV